MRFSNLPRLRARAIVLPVAAALAVGFLSVPGVATVPAQQAKSEGGAENRSGALPGDVRQLIVAIAKDWDSTRASLWRFERTRDGWQPVDSRPWPVLLGRNGLAWGRGVFAPPKGVSLKQEKDGRAPAGCFALGRIYTYDAELPRGASFPFVQVTKFDAWPDDPKNPYYNRHVRVEPGNVPSWFDSQKMRHGDFAYRWLVEIRHNSDPVIAGGGSAIFFHIRRGPDRPSAGCTTMEEKNLVTLMQWLRAEDRPHYVLLPLVEYHRLQPVWGMPPMMPTQ